MASNFGEGIGEGEEEGGSLKPCKTGPGQ